MMLRDRQLAERRFARRQASPRSGPGASPPASRRPGHRASASSEEREQGRGVRGGPLLLPGEVLGDRAGEPALPAAPVRFKRVASLVAQP
jgi:hypothetical protein